MVGVSALALGAFVAWLIARRSRLPYPVVLVAWGAALRIACTHWSALEPPLRLSPHVLLDVLLPPLLFEGAHLLRARDVRRSGRLIALLSVPGVLVGGVLAASLTWLALRFAGGVANPWPIALLFAAATSATDPVAVLAILRSANAAPSLRVVLDAESLLNDAMAVLALGVVVQLVTYGSPAVGFVLFDVAWRSGGGLVTGVVVGWTAAWLAARAAGAHALVPILLGIAAAYGAHALASTIGASSILAAVAAGFTWGNRYREPPAAVARFWDTSATAVNGLTFLLLGLELDASRIGRRLLLVVLAWTALLVARAAFVVVFTRLSREVLPAERALRVLVLGGIRGALPLVLALGLAPSSAREVVIDLTLGVIPLTLAQGLLVAYWSGPRRTALANAK